MLDFVLQVLLGFRPGARRTAEPRVVATARDFQEPAQATDADLGVLLVHPGVLHGSCCAKYAAAFFSIARSSFKRAFYLRRRFNAS